MWTGSSASPAQRAVPNQDPNQLSAIMVLCVLRLDVLNSERASRHIGVTAWIGCHPLDDDLVKLVRGQRGPCPGDDELHNYSRGALDAEVSSTLSSHIGLCGICQVRLKRLEDLE